MIDMFKEFQTIMSVFALISSLGISGMLFTIWIFDYKKEVKREKAFEAEINRHEERMAKMAEYQSDLLSSFKRERDQVVSQFEKWMGEMRQMYVNNVSLVKRYEALTDRVERLAEKAIEAIGYSNQVQAGLIGAVEKNQFCPIVRKQSGTNGEMEG